MEWEPAALVALIRRWPLRRRVVLAGSRILVWYLEQYWDFVMGAVDADKVVCVLSIAFDGLVEDPELLVRLAKAMESVVPSTKVV